MTTKTTAPKTVRTTAIAKPIDTLAVFPVLDPSCSAEIMELIEENLGTGGVDISNLDHVVVPPGGGKAFNLVDGVATELTGIIILAPQQNAYWPRTIEDEPNAPPVCTAPDARQAFGDPFNTGTSGPHDCTICPLKTWGSDTKGKGKACRDLRPIFLLQEGDYLPLVIQTPRMSIRPLQEYLSRLTQKGIPYYSAITQIRLTQTQRPGTPVFSALTFTLLDVIPRERRDTLRAYQQALRTQATQSPVAPPQNPPAARPSPANEPPQDPDSFDPWADEPAPA